jgi:transposase-like protein
MRVEVPKMVRTRRKGSRGWQSRRRWTAEDAREALAAAERSGQSQCQFAFEHGLDAQRLSRWKKQLGAPSTAVQPAFEEIPSSRIESAARAALGERFEVVLRSGRVVRVGESFNAEALRRLLSVVDPEETC